MRLKLKLIGFSIIIASSCGEDKSKSSNVYPPYIIESFMKGCTEDSPNNIEQTLLCSCLMEKIQEEYTVEEYLEIGKQGVGQEWDRLQDFMLKASKDCLTQK